MKTIIQVIDAATGDIITEKDYLCRTCAEEAVAALGEKLKERGYKLVNQSEEEWLFEKGKSQISVLIVDVIKV